jgi:hypothetical protein
LLCLTDALCLVYVLKHFGMVNIKFIASLAKSINLYKNTRYNQLNCCANIYFNKQCLVKKVIPKYASLKFKKALININNVTNLLCLNDTLYLVYVLKHLVYVSKHFGMVNIKKKNLCSLISFILNMKLNELFFVCLWRNGSQWARAYSFLRVLGF